MSAASDQVPEKKKGVQVIEIRFIADTESSIHKVFARDKGRTLREAVEPICRLKCIDLDRLGIYLDDDRSAALPLDYDIYSLTGHVLHVIEYKAPELSPEQVDGKLFQLKKLDNNSNFPLLTSLRPSVATTSRAASFAGKNREAVVFLSAKCKTPIFGRKSNPLKEKHLSSGADEMYPQRLSTGSTQVTRNTSAAGMLSQPGGRRPRQSEVVPPMNMTSRLLGLSEQHKKEHKKDHYEDDNGNERHRKQTSVVSEGHNSGEISPGGTLHKSKSSSAKLSIFSMQPQNSKSHAASNVGGTSTQHLLVSFIHTPAAAEAASARRRLQSATSEHGNKEREKMEILADLLEQWEKTGLPELPPLAGIGMPTFDPSKFEIEEHWTDFIDKTNLTQRQKDQQEALWELLYTEAEYIKALYVIHDLFICCLLNIQNAGVLNDIVISDMFCNITELATTNSGFWSNELIVVLEHSRKNKCLFNPSLLKPAFTNFGDKFLPYTKYCIEQKRCSDYVKKCHHEYPMLKAFVAWAEQQKQCNRLKLHDLLVKPMQRMTRYGLLLRAIHKKTDEEDVKQDLMDMIKNVDKFVTAVDQTLTRTDEKEKLIQTAARIEQYEAIETPLLDNECSKILAQAYMNLDLMSPMPGCGRQLRYNLMEGPLRLRDMSAKLDVHCILFTDMLLFTKPSKRDKLRIVKPPIRIDSLSIHEMKENPSLLLVHLTDFGVAQAAYALSGDNIAKWAKTFKKAQALYVKSKEQTRKESENISISDLDLDELGFSGPLVDKDNGDVFTDFADSVEPESSVEPSSLDSSQVQRVASFSSLTESDGCVKESSPVKTAITHSVSSPDIGRKHHTLPPNYKHPPRIEVQRKSSSSSGESSAVVNGERKSLGERRPAAERKRRVGAAQRYKTADGAMGTQTAVAQNNLHINTNDAHDQRISWQVGAPADQAVQTDSEDEFDMSSQLNCDILNRGTVSSNPSFQFSNSTSSLSQTNSAYSHSHKNELLSKSRSMYNTSADDPEQNRSKKLSQHDILRMKKFQDFLNDSTPGVEI